MPKAPTSIPTRAHMRWLLTCSLRPDILPQQLVHSVWTQIFCIHPLFHVVSAAPWEHFSRKAVTGQQHFSELVCLRAISLQAVLAGAKFYDYISFPRMAQQQSRGAIAQPFAAKGRNDPCIGSVYIYYSILLIHPFALLQTVASWIWKTAQNSEETQQGQAGVSAAR